MGEYREEKVKMDVYRKWKSDDDLYVFLTGFHGKDDILWTAEGWKRSAGMIEKLSLRCEMQQD